jgi:hypothetical protein
MKEQAARGGEMPKEYTPVAIATGPNFEYIVAMERLVEGVNVFRCWFHDGETKFQHENVKVSVFRGDEIKTGLVPF